MKITGLYPRVRVDTSRTAAVGQAGGVLLTRTVTATGLDRFLSAGLAGRLRGPRGQIQHGIGSCVRSRPAS